MAKFRVTIIVEDGDYDEGAEADLKYDIEDGLDYKAINYDDIAVEQIKGD